MKAVPLFRAIPLFLLCVFTFSRVSLATAAEEEPEVKLSASGICHDQSSRSFKRTQKFRAFDSIANCIAQGGRLPKSKTKGMHKATNEAIEQGRSFTALYDRKDWPHWLDIDKDCQNTRHEILLRTSTKVVSFKSDKQCNVLAGEWYDPYSSEVFTTSKELDLDHIVPLKFAHGHGASNWSREKKPYLRMI
ncbi:hypothetical protein RS130_22555 [Paraglaciecola aquimarina]|uniref:DUF1524 domain-containing protein n=1 Tax=Paraglaciecola aquimarina TaxID=1235557 RepID=A0ABU3T207_9ALTE|nr:hypothetical protein [Paraglaciecola aquimarina]MDU0356296.1 hypothetical protein [Paraglaciecola aquimarina]